MITRDEKVFQQIMEVDADMKAEKKFYEPVLQDIIDNVITHQPMINGEELPGGDRSTTMYDGTPRSALNIFTNGFSGQMVAQSLQWFKLKLADEDLNNIPAVREWLQDTERRMYAAFQRSNFYSVIKPYIKDGGSLGTASLYSEEIMANGKIFFATLPLRQYRIAENRWGVIDKLNREFKMTVRQLAQRFGRDNLTKGMQMDLQSEKGSLKKYKVLHAVYPRADIEDEKINRQSKPFASTWIALEDSHKDGSQILEERGYDEFPYSTWRYDKETGEIYGRSPAWDILAEIKGAHSMEKSLLKAGNLITDPPKNVHINQKGHYKRIPGAINYFRDEKEIARSEDLRINWPWGIEYQDRKRQVIKEAYFVDYFLLVTSRETTMTATEILELQGEKISILAPVVTSLNSEGLSSVIDRVFSIELNAGRLLPVPQELQGQIIDVEYIGPLAQAQKRAFETQGIRQSLESARPVLELFPHTADNIDWDETLLEILRGGSFPQKLIKDAETRDAERAERQAQIEEQVQSETDEIDSKTMKNVAQAAKNAS